MQYKGYFVLFIYLLRQCTVCESSQTRLQTSLMHQRCELQALGPGADVVRGSCIQYISVLLSNLETCGRRPPLRLHFNAALCFSSTERMCFRCLRVCYKNREHVFCQSTKQRVIYAFVKGSVPFLVCKQRKREQANEIIIFVRTHLKCPSSAPGRVYEQISWLD